jgi:hypothetical protein
MVWRGWKPNETIVFVRSRERSARLGFLSRIDSKKQVNFSSVPRRIRGANGDIVPSRSVKIDQTLCIFF